MTELLFDEATHTYTLDGKVLPSVTTILKGAGLVDDRFFNDFARDRGSAVHKACELWAKGTLDESTVDETVKPYLEGWKNWVHGSGFEPRLIEARVHSRVHGFAGTLDVYGTFVDDGALPAIVDIKTGNPGRTAGWQLAGYEIALMEKPGSFDRPVFVGRPPNRVVVQLDPAAYMGFRVYHYTDRSDRAVFLAANVIYKARKELGYV